MYQHGVHTQNVQYLRNEKKNCEIIMLKMASVYNLRFFQLEWNQ